MTKPTLSFRLPPNLRSLRDCRRSRITIGGKARAVSFVHYTKLDTYGVVLHGNGLVLIGRVEDGKWQAKLCKKVAKKTFAPTGVAGGSARTPKDAWAAIVPKVDKMLGGAGFEEAPV